MRGGPLVSLAAAGLLLAACAESPGLVEGSQAPPSSPSPTAETAGDLAAALEKWKDFPFDAQPRPLIVLRETRGGGFKSGEAKEAFFNGDWAVPDDLPATPSEFGGYPVLPAREALLRLRGEQAEVKQGSGDLAVQTVKLVTMAGSTDRGAPQLPAWRVDFVQGSQPVFVVAVADSARYVPQPKQIYYPSIGATGLESDIVLQLSDGGSVPGPCGRNTRIEAAESENAVAFRIVALEPPRADSGEEPLACPLSYTSAPTTLTLQRPLGGRVLLSVRPDRVEPVGLSVPKKSVSD